MLFQHFADEASARHGLPPHELQPGQRAMLLRHTWPGNVRELQNAAERFALGLELALDNNESQNPSGAPIEMVSGGLSEQVENFEKTLIAAELARSHSSVRSVAEALGVPRKTLHDKLRKHGLSFADSGAASHTDELD
jgi:two-component system C4-dicarboxylate transport response regulator DctD